MMRLARKASLLVALFLAGCTSIQVQPLSPTLQVKHVCILREGHGDTANHR